MDYIFKKVNFLKIKKKFLNFFLFFFTKKGGIFAENLAQCLILLKNKSL